MKKFIVIPFLFFVIITYAQTDSLINFDEPNNMLQLKHLKCIAGGASYSYKEGDLNIELEYPTTNFDSDKNDLYLTFVKLDKSLSKEQVKYLSKFLSKDIDINIILKLVNKRKQEYHIIGYTKQNFYFYWYNKRKKVS